MNRSSSSSGKIQLDDTTTSSPNLYYSGPEDLQDVPQPVAVVMPSVDEDGEESVPRQYPPMPNSPADMPFLQEDDSIGQGMTDDTPNTTDPRGEAPSYDEAIGMPLSEITLNDLPSNHASLPSTPEEPATRRISGFRSIINAVNRNRLSHAGPASLAHIRSNSENSIASSTVRTHHPTNSSTFFRTLSRQRSIRTINSNHLTSPSVVSVNSISAPLTHTVVRTEFTYPRAGPTPEQIRLISSPDAFTRFGVPYGADAIAFAASTSQQALEPPPDFDVVSSSTNLIPRVDTSVSAVNSGARNPPPTLPETTTETFVQRTELEVIPQTPIEAHEEDEEDEPVSPADSAAQAAEPAPRTSSDPVDIDKNNLSISSKRSLPPSSFQAPTEFGVRAESRVSSYTMQSYATASESMSAHSKAQAQGSGTGTGYDE